MLGVSPEAAHRVCGQAFHTDIGDILSLYTIETAGQGGKTTIVSSSTLYNMLAEDRPDLLEELGEPWVYFA